nr:MetaGeneMark_Unknown Function [uncultured bacterium]
MSARKIEQHYTEKNCEQALSGHAWQRQHYSERNQQHAGDVFPDHFQGVDPGSRSRPKFRFATLAEVIGRQLDQDQRNETEVCKETNKKNRDPDECFTPGNGEEKIR